MNVIFDEGEVASCSAVDKGACADDHQEAREQPFFFQEGDADKDEGEQQDHIDFAFEHLGAKGGDVKGEAVKAAKRGHLPDQEGDTEGEEETKAFIWTGEEKRPDNEQEEGKNQDADLVGDRREFASCGRDELCEGDEDIAIKVGEEGAQPREGVVDACGELEFDIP